MVCLRFELHPEKGEEISIDGRTSLSLTLSAHHNMQKAAPQNPASTVVMALLLTETWGEVLAGLQNTIMCVSAIIQCLWNLGTNNEVLKVSTEKKWVLLP